MRLKYSLGLLLLLVALPSTGSTADLVGDLKREQELLGTQIAGARAEAEKYDGGILKSLIGARLEILQTNAALIQQRIHFAESGAKVSITAPSYIPDPIRAAELEKDMRGVEQRIVTQEAESAKYTGGLVKAMVDSGIATSRLSLEMLRVEHLKAKYGIAWMPSLQPAGKSVAAVKEAVGRWSQQVAVTGSVGRREDFLVPAISNKRFQGSDWKSVAMRI